MVDLRLDGDVVSRLCFDYAVTLMTQNGSRLTFESDFALTLPDREAIVVDPERVVGVEAILSLLHQQIRSAAARSDGSVEVVFVNGATVAAVPDPHYEAWTLTGPNEFMVISTPGGGLA